MVAAAVLEAERIDFLVLAAGVAAVAVLANALARANPVGLVAGLAGIAASWSLSAWTRGAEAPAGTALVAVGVFVAAELAYWSLDQVPVPDELELLARRTAGLALRAGFAFVVASALLAALGLHASGGLALEALGVLAAVGVVALAFVLARSGSAAAER